MASLNKITPDFDGTSAFLIRSKLCDLVLDVTAGRQVPGTKIILYPEHGKNNQLWQFEPTGDGDFYIRSKGSQVYLRMSGEKDSYGHFIVAEKDPSQRWTLYEDEHDGIVLRTVRGKVIGLRQSDGKVTSEQLAEPYAWDATGAPDQIFHLEES